MTRQEAEYLQRLERAFGGLSQLLERQQVYISELQARVKYLEGERLRLEESLTTEQQKNNALLTARMIIAQDKDWADARQRLVGLKKNIQEALRLLETEYEAGEERASPRVEGSVPIMEENGLKEAIRRTREHV